MRLKHTLGATSLKMYDKAGCVLRIECTTSDVTAFQHRRKMEPRRSAGSGTSQSGAGSSGGTKWVPIRKTFYRLDAVAEAMSACNRRYLADYQPVAGPARAGGSHHLPHRGSCLTSLGLYSEIQICG